MRTAANNCVKEDARNVVRPTGTSQREIVNVTVCRCAKRALLRRWVTSFFICASLTRAAAVGGKFSTATGNPFFCFGHIHRFHIVPHCLGIVRGFIG